MSLHLLFLATKTYRSAKIPGVFIARLKAGVNGNFAFKKIKTLEEESLYKKL